MWEYNTCSIIIIIILLLLLSSLWLLLCSLLLYYYDSSASTRPVVLPPATHAPCFWTFLSLILYFLYYLFDCRAAEEAEDMKCVCDGGAAGLCQMNTEQCVRLPALPAQGLICLKLSYI